jgi:hypothetical protein
MAMQLKPLGARVVVEPLEQEEVTAGGIVLPETAKEKPQKGTVVAVGPGDRNGCRSRRYCIICQIQRDRNQNGRQENSDPARKRSTRNCDKIINLKNCKEIKYGC